MEDLDIIMKYRRDSDCWLCPECDTENPMTNGACSVCSMAYGDSATVLKQWTPEDDRINKGRPKDRDNNKDRTDRPERKTTYIAHDSDLDAPINSELPEQKSGAGRALAWILAIAIVIILVMVFSDGRYLPAGEAALPVPEISDGVESPDGAVYLYIDTDAIGTMLCDVTNVRYGELKSSDTILV